MKRRWPPWLAMLLVAWAAGAAAADTLRCGERVVSTGQSELEVRSACGAPDLVDVWDYIAYGRVVADAQQWVYDEGPNQLLRILHFEHGTLRRIEHDGYGFTAAGVQACRPHQIVEGMSKYRLLRSCGEPAQRDRAQLLAPLYPYRGDRFGRSPHVYREVYRERWIYDFGPNHLRRIVALENGRVRTVDHGARGGGP